MFRQYFYRFVLYTDFGRKLKDIFNSLIPGLIKEPQRVKVPVQGPSGGRSGRRDKE